MSDVARAHESSRQEGAAKKPHPSVFIQDLIANNMKVAPRVEESKVHGLKNKLQGFHHLVNAKF